MTLRPTSEAFYRTSLLGISVRLVPALLTCPAWETLLVAMLPPAKLSGLLELTSPDPRIPDSSPQDGDTIGGVYEMSFIKAMY